MFQGQGCCVPVYALHNNLGFFFIKNNDKMSMLEEMDISYYFEPPHMNVLSNFANVDCSLLTNTFCDHLFALYSQVLYDIRWQELFCLKIIRIVKQ